MPAFLAAMDAEKAEMAAIAGNSQAPTFENTIEAMEKSGEMLDRIGRVFGCLNSANTNDALQEISKEAGPAASEAP